MAENKDINVATKEVADKVSRVLNKERILKSDIIEYNTNTCNENDIWHCKLTFTYWTGSFVGTL